MLGSQFICTFYHPPNFSLFSIRRDLRNPATPRLASSSNDGTVRVWSTTTRRTEYTLGGHSASVNVVKWGGSGGKKGVLYTASSDGTVRIWDAETVSSFHSSDYTETNFLLTGSPSAYLERACALGYDSDIEHGFRLADRSL